MWIRPECDSTLGIAVSITVQALEAAFAEAASRQLKVGAVLVVSPTYFGTCSDIAGDHACSSSPFTVLASCQVAVQFLKALWCKRAHIRHVLQVWLSCVMRGAYP